MNDFYRGPINFPKTKEEAEKYATELRQRAIDICEEDIYNTLEKLEKLRNQLKKLETDPIEIGYYEQKEN